LLNIYLICIILFLCWCCAGWLEGNSPAVCYTVEESHSSWGHRSWLGSQKCI